MSHASASLSLSPKGDQGDEQKGIGLSGKERENTDPKPKAYSDRRLFVANLAPSVTEHDLLKIFQSFGTLRKLDIIFHRNGPLKGRPKGYAFVEFETSDQANKAKSVVEGRQVKGRQIHLHFATLSEEEAGHFVGPHRRFRHIEDIQPTTLSLAKNLNRKDSTEARIAAMEAKLEAMRSRTNQEGQTSSSERKRHPLPSRPYQNFSSRKP